MIYLLHQALEESAQQYPGHDAMRFKGKALSYAELSRRSNQAAHLLIEAGVSKGDRVGVFLSKSLETSLAIYAIMKAGAAYVPLDPASPAARVASIVEDCCIHCIISEPSKAAILAEVAAQQPGLHSVMGAGDIPGLRAISWDDVAAYPLSSMPTLAMSEQDLAYIMYTSGSTGKPKGIMHTHYSGLSYARLSAMTYDVQSSDRLGNHSPLHFDMSTFDYLTGPMCGATTVVIPEAYTLFPANLSQLIESERLSIWYSVPYALIQLLLRGVMEQRDLSSLRWIMYGGEPFPLAHLRSLMERLPDARVSNVYGPAEVNQCTWYHVPPPADWPSEELSIPLGHIWDNSSGLILDEQDQPVEDGQIGELVLRSPTMMQGYWNRPDLNAKAFYRYERFPGFVEVYYRTGDLVCVRPDGLMDFLGRKDHQVKVRGFRVELAEIDSALNSHPAVEEASAFAIRDEAGDQIWAAVIVAQGQDVAERELITYLGQRLSPYAVPGRVLFKQSFARGGTGKIDRQVLQAEAQALFDADKAGRA